MGPCFAGVVLIEGWVERAKASGRVLLDCFEVRAEHATKRCLARAYLDLCRARAFLSCCASFCMILW